MSDLFDNITTRLDISKSSVDSSVDKVRSKGRAIKKTQLQISLAEVTTVFNSEYWKRILKQYNIEVTNDFRILSASIVGKIPATGYKYLVCIKHRVGSTVTRYRLGPKNIDPVLYDLWKSRGLLGVQATDYTNELIQRNFCIEYWGYSVPGNQIPESVTLNLNILTIPTSVNELYTEATEITELTRASMELTLPLTLPVTFGEQAGTNN